MVKPVKVDVASRRLVLGGGLGFFALFLGYLVTTGIDWSTTGRYYGLMANYSIALTLGSAVVYFFVLLFWYRIFPGRMSLGVSASLR